MQWESGGEETMAGLTPDAELTEMLDALVDETCRLQEQLHVQGRVLETRLRELRGVQEQLIVADRRATVGTLSAGVAHEINNPLAYITANIQFALQELRRLAHEAPSGGGCPFRDEEAQELINALCEASDGCSRVQHIVLSLKSFSAGDDDRRAPLELSQALKTAINMAGNEIRHRARLVLDYEPVPTVEASEVRLSQVFLNLLINAAHAIAPGAVEHNEIRVSTRLGADGRVRVSITDTGGGMTSEVRERLFTPFFTTKPVGVGTGLGLSVCQGIVRGLGGQIEVRSESGQGSTFTVILPAAVAPRSPDPRPRAPALKERRARVLVVDDEPRVGSSLRRALSREHDVVVTSGGREALAHVCQGEPFDVILCDVMMPEMTGVEFFTELRRTSPHQAEAVLFLTGGALTEAAAHFLGGQRERVLLKPLDVDRLRERLQALLEQRTPARSVPSPSTTREEEAYPSLSLAQAAR